MDIFDVWHWFERIAGVIIVVCLCLYLIRCAVGGTFIGVDTFARFVQGLFHYIRT